MSGRATDRAGAVLKQLRPWSIERVVAWLVVDQLDCHKLKVVMRRKCGASVGRERPF
jgi:hypothetical protein